MSLQLTNSPSWPFMTILASWACLLFFGFGMLARVNCSSVLGLAVGALSVARSIFLIIELSTPYSGLLRLPPEPVLKTIEALGKYPPHCPHLVFFARPGSEVKVSSPHSGESAVYLQSSTRLRRRHTARAGCILRAKVIVGCRSTSTRSYSASRTGRSSQS